MHKEELNKEALYSLAFFSCSAKYLLEMSHENAFSLPIKLIERINKRITVRLQRVLVLNSC